MVEILENLAFLANASNLVLYLSQYMHVSPSKAANNVTNFMGTAFLLALLGGFLSDAFFTTYHIYLISAVIEFLVIILFPVPLSLSLSLTHTYMFVYNYLFMLINYLTNLDFLDRLDLFFDFPFTIFFRNVFALQSLPLFLSCYFEIFYFFIFF